MDLVPERLREHSTDRHDQVVLLIPRFTDPVLGRLLQPRLPFPHFKVHLDRLGSLVWLNCDGSKTVREIASVLAEQFGQDLDPGHGRLALFLLSLEEAGHIRYAHEFPGNPARTSPAP